MNNVLKLKQLHKKVKIEDKLSETIDKGTQIDRPKIEEYQLKSIEMTTDLIKFQGASKLASKPLSYIGLDIKDVIKLSIWESDTEFILSRFELEGELISDGFRWLGYNVADGKPWPFVAKMTELELDPIIRSKVLKVTYQIGELTVSGKEYTLEESWELLDDGKYQVKRSLAKTKTWRGKKHNIPEEYMRDEIVDEIQGIPFYNNLSHKSDIENVKHFMRDKGSFSYYLLEKFEYLSPKIFNKSSVMDGNESEINNKMRTQTFFNITSRAGQFQQPVTVFNPTLPNSTIQQTIQFYDDQIFLYSLASRPQDSGKQAQTGDMETALKNELAHNYIEFKKLLRETQLTRFMKLIAKELKISVDKEDFRVEIELSMTQQRQLDPTIDKAAAGKEPGTGGE